jgi:hypothetical protein
MSATPVEAVTTALTSTLTEALTDAAASAHAVHHPACRNDVIDLTGSNVIAGRYHLGRLLGSGGTGQVWQATDTQLDRQVALKLITAQHSEAARRAAQEARLLARLKHSSLVAVHDAGTDSRGRPWLVMELIEGPSLAAVLDRGPLLPDSAGRIGLALAHGLEYVHGQKVLHRDVKPSNVLIGADGRPRLADFGIARAIDAARVTSTGLLVGTAAFMAPEQVAGEPVGPPADIYALGLVLLEVLTGRREYEGSTIEIALARLRRQPHVPGTLPGRWPALLRAMTARNPQGRPTARQVAEQLVTIGRRQDRSPTTPGPTATPATTPVPRTPAAAAQVTATPPAQRQPVSGPGRVQRSGKREAAKRNAAVRCATSAIAARPAASPAPAGKAAPSIRPDKAPPTQIPLVKAQLTKVPVRRRRRLRRTLTLVLGVPTALTVTAAVACAALRWIEPPTTMFMHNDQYIPTYQYTPLSEISPEMVAATIVHEDPEQEARYDWPVINHPHGGVLGDYDRPHGPGFLNRTGGTDWDRLLVRAEAAKFFGRDVGGSTTIEQQTVKNLFLTPDKAPWRKLVVEPLLADIYGLTVPKDRKIELYLNIAEFGPGIFGVCAASWYYFDTAPRNLTMQQAADLVAVMPMPKQFRRSIHGGVLPLDVPPGSVYSPKRLLDYSRKHVAGQVEHDQVLQNMTAAGIVAGQGPFGSCERMPSGVARTLNEGLLLQHPDR